VTLVDGKYHDTDSSEIAFQGRRLAGLSRRPRRRAKPVLLEPIFAVEVRHPRRSSWATSSAT